MRGNIDFHDNSINADEASSRRPGQLQIYGEDLRPATRPLFARDTAKVCAAFYGPSYDVSVDGGVEWCGAIVGRSFESPHGGNGGLHYDHALEEIGPTVSYRIVRYVEDARQ